MADTADANRVFARAEALAQTMRAGSGEFMADWPGRPLGPLEPWASGGRWVRSGGRFALGRAIGVAESKLCLNEDGQTVWLVVVTLQCTCIGRKACKSRYRQYRMYGMPHGSSPRQTLDLGDSRDGVRLVHSFPEGARDCISRLAVSRETSPVAP